MEETLQAPPTPTTVTFSLDAAGDIQVLQDSHQPTDGKVGLKKNQVVTWKCEHEQLAGLVLVIKGAAKSGDGVELAAKPSSPIPRDAYWWHAEGGTVEQAVRVKDQGLAVGDEWDYGVVLCLAGTGAKWLDPRIIIRPS